MGCLDTGWGEEIHFEDRASAKSEVPQLEELPFSERPLTRGSRR